MIKRRSPRRVSRVSRRKVARQMRVKPSLEQRYVTALQGVVRALHRDVEAAVFPQLADYARADALNPFSGEIDGVLLKHIASAPRLVTSYFTRQAQAVADENAQALRVVGIKPSDIHQLAPVIAHARDANIQLVEKAMRVYAQDVRDIFTNPDTFGLRVEEIQKRLVERGNVSESRAALIARDQTLKLNGAITKARQQAAGFTHYIWSTSLDERVREDHAELEGQTFDWNSPPPPGHPGQDFQCRCVAVPAIEGLDDISDLPEIPDDAPAEEVPAEPVAVVAEGTHFATVDSTLAPADTKDYLSSLDDEETRDILSGPGQEVQTLYLRPSGININGTRVDGSYNYAQRRVELATTRPAHEYGRPFVPGKTFKVSAAATTEREATKIDLRHEVGHHVHAFDLSGRAVTPVDDVVYAAYQRALASDTFITHYARGDRFEYFAESYAAYYHRTASLKAHDPNGHAMVEAVLRLRGAKK